MLIKEFRVVMPLTVQEFQVGQLYSIAMSSMNETGGGEGVEFRRNEPFDNYPLLPGGRFSRGQYTYKIYHVASRLPTFLRMLLPPGSTEIHEEAWNAFPYCRTIVKNPGYMKESFSVCVESLHLPDRGTTENAHGLSPDKLLQRQVVTIDILSDQMAGPDYKASEDPSKFKSTKTERGPLIEGWREAVEPVMTCYKLVTCEFKWFGVQNRAENYILGAEKRLFTKLHRQIFCWLDQWHGMDLDEIRELEERVRDDLDRERKKGGLKGARMTFSEATIRGPSSVSAPLSKHASLQKDK